MAIPVPIEENVLVFMPIPIALPTGIVAELAIIADPKAMAVDCRPRTTGRLVS